MTKKLITIDCAEFCQAFGRDRDFHHPYPADAYLDKQTGDIRWVYDQDEDAAEELGIPESENRESRMLVASDPERFLRVPGLSHAEHHDILRAFLDSRWTDDLEERERVKAAFFGSIGGWRKTVGSAEAVDAFGDFKEDQIRGLAGAFLAQHGIKTDWC